MVDFDLRKLKIAGASPGKAAVMQICLDTSHCHVMHIFHSGIPKTLRLLLENSLLLKVCNRATTAAAFVCNADT